MGDETSAEPISEHLPCATPAAPPASAEVTAAFDSSTKPEVSSAIQVPASEPHAGQAGRPGPVRHKSLPFLQPGTQPGSLGRLGHFEVLDLLGKGGFGIVLKAFDDKLQRLVAIKVLGPQLSGSANARSRFVREARAAAAVNHKYVISTYEVYEQPIPYLVMEYVDGKSLQDRLDQLEPFSTRDILRIGAEIAQGLAAAHQQGLIHRDIKPANILLETGVRGQGSGVREDKPSSSLTPDPWPLTPVQIKIADFGLARAVDDISLTQSGMIAGTPLFMSPEQARGETLDPRSDLFSLGSVLYTLCTSHPPFKAHRTIGVMNRVCEDTPKPIREINPAIPEALVEIVNRLLAKDPAGRFQTATELAERLEQQLAQLDEPAPSSPSGGHVGGAITEQLREESPRLNALGAPRKKAQLRRSLLGLGVAAALVAALGGYLALGPADRLSPPEESGNGQEQAKAEAPPPASPPEESGNGQKARPIDPDRRAAKYVLSTGGTVWVNGGTGFHGGTAFPSEQGQKIKAAADLPREPFRLTAVVLDGSRQVTDAGLAILRDCKNLALLKLVNTPVTDAGVTHIPNCRELWLQKTRLFTDAALAHLPDCKGLWQLHLVLLPKVTDAGLVHLKDCESLTFLNLDSTPVTDAGLVHLKHCKKLIDLLLHNNKRITDAGLVHLKSCKNLKAVNLRATSATAAGIDELKKALPQCKIEWNGGVIEPKVGAAPFSDADAKRIAGLSTAVQVEEVRKELMRRNPGFDGAITPTVENDVVTGLELSTKQVSIVAPVRALTNLKNLQCITEKLSDLAPLKGLKLATLDLSGTEVSDLYSARTSETNPRESPVNQEP